MAEKIILGKNGNWGVKENGLLGYNDEDNVFKAIEMDFSRSSTATRQSSAGLIADSPIDTPRIDFSDSSDGALLLEPESRNLVEYSEDGTEWNTTNSTVSLTTDSASPSGQSSVYKVNDDATDAQHRVDVRPSITSGTEYTLSAFVKKPSDSDIDFVYLIFATNFSTARFYFNIAEGTSLDAGGTIENYGNGWYRLSASATANSNGNGIFGVNLTDGDGNNTYVGTGNGSMYVWGIQVEEKSYATSYIPNFGTALGVTRIADTCSKSGLENYINSSEGVLYAETSSLANDGTDRVITLSNGTTSQRVTLFYSATSNRIEYSIVLGTLQASGNYTLTDATDFAKIALKYKENDFALYVNGLLVAVDTNGSTFSSGTLTKLAFDVGNGTFPFYGKVKDVRVYDTALTDAELTTLTTL